MLTAHEVATQLGTSRTKVYGSLWELAKQGEAIEARIGGVK